MGCSTTLNCILGGSALGSKKFNDFETGKKAAEELLSSVSVRACVDQYVQDQLIIFMALAKGKSVIKTTPITLHTETAIFIAQLLTDVSISILQKFSDSGNFQLIQKLIINFYLQAKFKVIKEETTCTIECEGIGLENKF